MTITIDNEKEFNWLAADLIDNHISFISGVVNGKFEIETVQKDEKYFDISFSQDWELSNFIERYKRFGLSFLRHGFNHLTLRVYEGDLVNEVD